MIPIPNEHLYKSKGCGSLLVGSMLKEAFVVAHQSRKSYKAIQKILKSIY